MATAAALTWESVDGVAEVTFDLPGESVNKITQSVKDEFVATFETLARDPDVKAVVFRSGKADIFIAGADVEEFVALQSAAEAERLAAGGQDMLDRVARFPKPVVASIHGACLGGGLDSRSPAATASPRITRRPSWAFPRCSSESCLRPAVASACPGS